MWYPMWWKTLPEPSPEVKKILNKKTALYLAAHICSIMVAVGTGIQMVGPGKIQGLFSHDPVQIMIAIGALLVAVGTALGAGANGQLFKQPEEQK